MYGKGSLLVISLPRQNHKFERRDLSKNCGQGGELRCGRDQGLHFAILGDMPNLFRKQGRINRNVHTASLRNSEYRNDLRDRRLEINAYAVPANKACSAESFREPSRTSRYLAVTEALIAMNQCLFFGRPLNTRAQHVMNQEVHSRAPPRIRIIENYFIRIWDFNQMSHERSSA